MYCPDISYCLKPNEHLTFDEMMMIVQYQTNTLSWILMGQLTETKVHGQTCRSARKHHSDSDLTSLYSYSLMLRAQRRNKTYQFNRPDWNANPRFDEFWCLTPLSAIFQQYHGDQFQWWKKPEYPERTTDHGQATDQLYHLRLLVECTLFVTLVTSKCSYIRDQEQEVQNVDTSGICGR